MATTDFAIGDRVKANPRVESARWNRYGYTYHLGAIGIIRALRPEYRESLVVSWDGHPELTVGLEPSDITPA